MFIHIPAGKQVVALLSQTGSGETVGSRLYIKDRIAGFHFLIDTGADIAVIPRQRNFGTSTPTWFQLYAADRSVIRTYSDKVMNLTLGLKRNFTWRFCIADLSRLIIGVNLLKFYSILVDVKNRRDYDTTTKLSTAGHIATSEYRSISTVCETSVYHGIFKEFPSLTNPSLDHSNATHEVHHHIVTTGSPLAERPRRLSGKVKSGKIGVPTFDGQELLSTVKQLIGQPVSFGV